MYDCSVWTHTGNGWEAETNKIFLLAEKHTKSIIKVTQISKAEETKREKRERDGEGEGGSRRGRGRRWKERKREKGERIGRLVAYVVHLHVQEREL